jgi:hypothetical protein
MRRCKYATHFCINDTGAREVTHSDLLMHIVFGIMHEQTRVRSIKAIAPEAACEALL